MKKSYTKIRGPFHLSAAIMIFLSATLLSACGGGGGGGAGNSGGTTSGGVSGGSGTSTARTAQSVFIRAKDSGRPLLISVADDGGTQPLTLASSNLFSAIGQFALSPDKGHLAFIADGGLFVVKADGSGLVRLSKLNNAAGKVTDFEWSPDGISLVYLADGEVPDQFELYQVKSDGSDREEKRRISGPFGIRTTLDVAAPHWSPDGRYVAYLVLDNGRSIGLNTHDTTSSDPRDSVRVSFPNTFALWQDIAGYDGDSYKWSPDSHYLAYRSDALMDNLYEIFTVHPDGSDFRRANATTGKTLYLGNFKWSPDSRYLAESVYYVATGLYAGINTWDTQDSTGNPSNRVASARQLGGFTWAHHDSRLAFVDDHVAVGIPELYVHDPLTMSTMKVNHGGPSGDGVERFNWSPHDRYLGYNTKSGLYRAISNSSDPSQAIYTYSNTEHNFGGWAWSPDEEQVGYWVFNNPSLRQNDTAKLYISTVASPGTPFLALGPHQAIELPLIQWSDDSQVLVAEIEGGVFGVYGVLNYSLSGSYQSSGFVY